MIFQTITGVRFTKHTIITFNTIIHMVDIQLTKTNET